MIKETVDKSTGTILFHEDEDTVNIRLLLKIMKELNRKVDNLIEDNKRLREKLESLSK